MCVVSGVSGVGVDMSEGTCAAAAHLSGVWGGACVLCGK